MEEPQEHSTIVHAAVEPVQRSPDGKMVVICRICLSTCPRMISIHSPVPEYDQKTLYAMLLSVCLPLNQRETVQGFPEQICRNCQWKLLSAYDLYETTLASDEQLRAQNELGTAVKVSRNPQISEVIKPDSAPLPPNVTSEGLMRVKEETPDDGYEEQFGPGSRTEFDSSTIYEPSEEMGAISVYPVVSMLVPHSEQRQEEAVPGPVLVESKPPIPDPLESFIEEHYQVDEGNGNHVCGLCKQDFPYKSQCRMHIVQKHNPAKPFKCDICFCTLTSHLRLVRHKIVAHGAGQIKREDVIEAQNDSTGEMTYTCPICRKVFNSSVRFKRHKNVHVVHNRPFKCEVCLYRFATKPQLTQHAKVHETKPDPGLAPGSGEVGEFPCDRCEEIFTAKRTLTMHLKKAHQVYRVPGGARPDERERSEYVCIICKATFARETVLNTHMKMHELLAAEKEKERRLDLERMVKQELQQQMQMNMPPLPPLSPEVIDRSACVLEPFALGLVPVAKPGTNNNNNTSINNNSPPTAPAVGGSGGPSGSVQSGKRKVPISPAAPSDMAYVCPVCDMEFDERDALKKHQKEQHARLQVGIVSSKLGDSISPNSGCSPQAKMMPRFSDMPGMKRRLMDGSVRTSKERLLTNTTTMSYINHEESLGHDESLESDGHFTAGLLPIDDIPASSDRRSASGTTATSPGEEPFQFQCGLCHKKFSYNCYLTMHMRKNHDKSKPFGCKVCHYRFRYRGTLLRHQLIHSSQRVQPGSHGSIIFKCRICSAKFLELKQLNVHLKTHRKVPEVHDTSLQVQLIQCDECPQIFSEPNQLAKHMLKEHQEQNSTDDELYDTVQHAGLLMDQSASSLRADKSCTGVSTLNDLKLNSGQSKNVGTTNEAFLDDDISMIKLEPTYD
uniref:Zinc finger protein n=1 Tax=Anopheles funestus TaxID=62324 RepID=A0A182RXT4_ANOFN